jgi:hypothetical protein
MRWTVDNDGLEAAPPTLYIQGVEPLPGEIDATDLPVIELLAGDDSGPPMGIAYLESLAAGVTLRLAPAYSSWLGQDSGLWRSRSPAIGGEANPTAPGPWQQAQGAPEGKAVAVCQSYDRALWVAAIENDSGKLHRFDGQQWREVADDLPIPHCLGEDKDALLVGTADGLWRVPLLVPEDELTASRVPGLTADLEVHALLASSQGGWWLGTSQGLSRLRADGTVQPFFLKPEGGTGVAVYDLMRDWNGHYFLGTELGCFQYMPESGAWYWYGGAERSDQEPRWHELALSAGGEPQALPDENDVFLPPVRAVYRGPDSSLWLGTKHGIARYLARSVRGLTFETILEAFPDLGTGMVHTIAEDERGLVWFATDHGLLRYDGRDWWQAGSEGWQHLGVADMLPNAEERGAWRWDRSASEWQRWQREQWLPYAGETRTTAADAVYAVAWSDEVDAELGSWDGTTFSADSPVDSAKLRMRCKPRPEVIVDGGIPALPRLPVGESEWRYLSFEDQQETPAGEDRPAWTIEGRLLPPPVEAAAPHVGRLGLPESGNLDRSIFAYSPAARVWLTWNARRPLTVLARLMKRQDADEIDPAIIERVWQGMQLVRPAGVRVALAVEESTLRGDQDGESDD